MCVTLVEWLRRVRAKYMGFPRESSNLSSDVKESFNAELISFFLLYFLKSIRKSLTFKFLYSLDHYYKGHVSHWLSG